MITEDDSTEQEFEELAKMYPELMEKSQQDYIGVDKGWHNVIRAVCHGFYERVESAKSRLAYAKDKVAKGETVDLSIYESALQREIDNLPVISQIKEKFGTLRFYAHNCDDRTDAIINFAEYLSAVTCEKCGKPGKLDTNGWMKTHCEDHFRNVTSD